MGSPRGSQDCRGTGLPLGEGRTYCSSQWGKKGNSNLSFLYDTGGKVFYSGVVVKVGGGGGGRWLDDLIAV